MPLRPRSRERGGCRRLGRRATAEMPKDAEILGLVCASTQNPHNVDG